MDIITVTGLEEGKDFGGEMFVSLDQQRSIKGF